MRKNLIVTLKIAIDASIETVWDALVNPVIVSKYMLGAKQESKFITNSPITWTKNLNGKTFMDHGTILKISKNKLLKYSHYSPVSGKTDTLENYAVVTIQLIRSNGSVMLKLESDNNDSLAEKMNTKNIWNYYLLGLRILCEM